MKIIEPEELLDNFSGVQKIKVRLSFKWVALKHNHLNKPMMRRRWIQVRHHINFLWLLMFGWMFSPEKQNEIATTLEDKSINDMEKAIEDWKKMLRDRLDVLDEKKRKEMWDNE